MASSTIGAYLQIGPDALNLDDYDIKSYPDLIGQPERVDVTCLTDVQRKYVPGVEASDTLQFVMNYDATVYGTLEDMQGTSELFVLVLPDGAKFTWEGVLTLGVPGKGVNDAIEFTVNVELDSSSDVTYNAPTP